MKKHYTKDFVSFVREQGVVGLAIGLAIGTQATILARSIVDSFVTPIVNLLVGKEGLRGLTWTVHIAGRTATFDIGSFVNALLQFLAVTLVVYVAFRVFRLDRLEKPKEK